MALISTGKSLTGFPFLLVTLNDFEPSNSPHFVLFHQIW